MNDDLRSKLGAAMIAIALAGGCGDSAGDETGNDTQTGSASTTTTGTESTGNESSSTSQTASATNTTSTTNAESSSSGTDATATTTSTESSSSGADGSSSGGSSSGSSSESGMMCSAESESCANGEMCCAGMHCCAGNPIPPGSEYCTAGICPVSDRNVKENFAAIDPAVVLDKVAALPITTWSYKAEGPSVRHIGPMAQDFEAAFGVGATDKAIFQVDADGVALASVQALHRSVTALQAENDELRKRLDQLEAALAQRAR